MQWLSVLVKLLELLADYFTRQNKQKEIDDVKQVTKDTVSNPRDFFDDGMLNDSQRKDKQPGD